MPTNHSTSVFVEKEWKKNRRSSMEVGFLFSDVMCAWACQMSLSHTSPLLPLCLLVQKRATAGYWQDIMCYALTGFVNLGPSYWIRFDGVKWWCSQHFGMGPQAYESHFCVLQVHTCRSEERIQNGCQSLGVNPLKDAVISQGLSQCVVLMSFRKHQLSSWVS